MDSKENFPEIIRKKGDYCDNCDENGKRNSLEDF